MAANTAAQRFRMCLSAVEGKTAHTYVNDCYGMKHPVVRDQHCLPHKDFLVSTAAEMVVFLIFCCLIYQTTESSTSIDCLVTKQDRDEIKAMLSNKRDGGKMQKINYSPLQTHV